MPIKLEPKPYKQNGHRCEKCGHSQGPGEIHRIEYMGVGVTDGVQHLRATCWKCGAKYHMECFDSSKREGE